MKGKISITRICTNQIGRNNNIIMRIENDKADEKLGLALTGLAFQDCEITKYGGVQE